MDKETCQKLYQEYQELKKKTNVEVYTRETGKDCHLQNIKVNDMNELCDVREKLKTCLEFLTDDELIELLDDSKLEPEAKKILNKRKEG